MRGVYKIINKTNNKVYIGESLDIIRRWEEHKEDLNSDTHHSYKLQSDWNKYGEDNFNFTIEYVLDDSVPSFYDKYILLIYEYKSMNRYNSIEDGYNIENTLKEIQSENKSVMRNKADTVLLEKVCEQIKSKAIKEHGGIIYKNIFSMDNVFKQTDLKSRNQFRKILLDKNYLIKKEGRLYILNENMFNIDDIICNESFSKIRFNNNIYHKLLEIMNKVIEEDNIEIDSSEKKEIKQPKKENKKSTNNVENDKNIYSSDIPKNICTIKEFLNNYTLNIKYNKVFEFLRINGILEYAEMDGKQINCPTDKFKKWFKIQDRFDKNNNKYSGLFITYEGKKEIEKILIDNSIISLNT